MADKPTTPLSESQQEIMEIVWEAGEVSAAEVREILSQKRKVARNTVNTLMTRMYEKGWLKYRSIGRTFVYSATVPKTTSLGLRAKELIDSTFGGSAEELMTALIQYRGLTRKESANIRRMLEESEGKKKTRKGER